MYALLEIFDYGPGMRPAAEALAAHIEPLFRDQTGFRRVTFLADDATGEYGTLSLWDTRDDARAADDAIRPALEEVQNQAGVILEEPPDVRIYEVFGPDGS